MASLLLRIILLIVYISIYLQSVAWWNQQKHDVSTSYSQYGRIGFCFYWLSALIVDSSLDDLLRNYFCLGSYIPIEYFVHDIIRRMVYQAMNSKRASKNI